MITGLALTAVQMFPEAGLLGVAAPGVRHQFREQAVHAPRGGAALAPATCDRALICDGYTRLQQWTDDSQGLLSIVPPGVTALGFVRYHLERHSPEVAHVLREHGNVLVAAGEQFGAEHHLHITHGLEKNYLDMALISIGCILAELG